MESRYILRMRVDATSYADAAKKVLKWGKNRESRYVVVANVHDTMETYDSKEFCRVVNGGDLNTPDGKPLVWCLKLLGVKHATRVYGPNLMPYTLGEAEKAGVSVGFHGSSPETLDALLKEVARLYPKLNVAYSCSPPFRTITDEEDEEIVQSINNSGAEILFVGLGCPKQERWMAAHKGRVTMPMLGVGAAFDFLAGTKPWAPKWIQEAGLEWLFRFFCEPKRLFVRYMKHNPRFIFLFLLQYLGIKKFRH